MDAPGSASQGAPRQPACLRCQGMVAAMALSALAAVPRRRADLEAEVRELVSAAREAGASWSQIGAALDTSKQAARERYGS